MDETRIVLLAGLPRSGSTVLCNLLGAHPAVVVSPSSPLCAMLNSLRRFWSDEPALLSQLEADYEATYARLGKVLGAIVAAWHPEPGKLYVDKARRWLTSVPLLREVFPEFRMIVTLRDLRGVLGSIERQHRKTMLLDFADDTEPYQLDSRAAALFSPEGWVGFVLRALQNLDDMLVPPSHFFFWRYEDFLGRPLEATNALLQWLGLDSFRELPSIAQIHREADSYYRFKFPHEVRPTVSAPAPSPLPPRIAAMLVNQFRSYYERFYPEALDRRDVPGGGLMPVA